MFFRIERPTEKCYIGRKSKMSSMYLANYSLKIVPTENTHYNLFIYLFLDFSVFFLNQKQV